MPRFPNIYNATLQVQYDPYKKRLIVAMREPMPA